ncbi:MAG: FAD-dependent oxidoreductase [Sphingobacteriia bacterium]|nr:FAD-dependent oxidoreductase [Sphingobacteriia bacterium]NCC41454.1 FAD-dependent oxidoreductase [Gammaproteobacteria bacterium]
MAVDVIVIGAGLSGLACALRLRQAGLEVQLIEAADRAGGRIATDRREGFLLDRGFQVLQTWYPRARRLLDYAALDLRPFYPGALVRIDGRFHRVSDIWRHPGRLPEMLGSPIGTVADKLRLLALRRRALRGSIADLYARPEMTATQLLDHLGFSPRIQTRFFKPFFAGVFFEPDLAVSSRAFEFVFRAFALGDTALPAGGMAEIPSQLASRLPPGCIRYGARVERLLADGVLLERGERLAARAIVVATDGGAAARLLGVAPPPLRGTSCLYFAAPEPPFAGPDLVLNGTGQGPINSLLCPSNLSGAYAPAGQALITVNCFGTASDPEALESAVRAQLRDWYGAVVARWRPLAVYRLPAALPAQAPPVTAPARPAPLREGLWVCGESTAPPSIHWALASGTETAEALIETLGIATLGAGRSAD